MARRGKIAGQRVVSGVALALLGLLAACTDVSGASREAGEERRSGEASSPVAPSTSPGPTESPSTPVSTPGSASPSATTPSATTPAATPAADARPHLPGTAPDRTRPWPGARVSIPAIGLDGLRVRPYEGEPDDGPGTEIQDRGVAATPRGPDGGVGPGEIGNMIVTGHRTSAGAPFADLPALRRGEHVLVTSRGWVYDYEVRRSMWISFRSERSKARQAAPVPGRLGEEPVRAMLTLSTCATPEDVAAGRLWKDEFGNLEHRIDKVGVLVGVRPSS
jgi:sortase A